MNQRFGARAEYLIDEDDRRGLLPAEESRRLMVWQLGNSDPDSLVGLARTLQGMALRLGVDPPDGQASPQPSPSDSE